MADDRLTAAAALAQGWGIVASSLEPLGHGHINDTLLVRAPIPKGLLKTVTKPGSEQRQVASTPGAETAAAGAFVLQRINQSVFTDPGRVTSNLLRIVQHLQGKGVPLAPLFLTTTEDAAWVDDDGDWWRLWAYVAASRSLSQSADRLLAEAAGEVFGAFQAALADLPGPPLEATIPGFLELDGYLDRFDAVRREHASLDREARTCLGESLDGATVARLRTLTDRFPPGDTLIHGDCKLNNLLFAADAPTVLAIVDLDTVMRGHWAWDFGDLVRSLLGGADNERAGAEVFQGAVRGYLHGACRSVSAEDLALAPRYVAFMLGIRFLTDHLEGDRYFRVAHRGDNRSRASAQFELLRRFPAERLEALAREVPGVMA